VKRALKDPACRIDLENQQLQHPGAPPRIRPINMNEFQIYAPDLKDR
jgi:hypothetical protein